MHLFYNWVMLHNCRLRLDDTLGELRLPLISVKKVPTYYPLHSVDQAKTQRLVADQRGKRDVYNALGITGYVKRDAAHCIARMNTCPCHTHPQPGQKSHPVPYPVCSPLNLFSRTLCGPAASHVEGSLSPPRTD